MSPDVPQIATDFRCAAHDVVLPTADYHRHIREAHEGLPITITLIWRDA